ncbi:hypothetical protein CO229_03430 [Mycoplasmopsis bovirhinis]|uniref:HinT-interacting membrane complex protein P80 n=1 Tax=Mycoplasmopsis bovirhinis TaxID=29553 RepID=UPI000C058A48|nr:hypothetical protein [Mycoplasmopsis bovirhinis]ATO31125.1 hypothetical protein CO229_03430 [Mycoplasmopsis bovirhinis]
MAKRQRSFFERLSELNDNFDDKNKKVSRKTKRNWINYTILGTLAAMITAGITIPLVINTTKVNYIEPHKGDKRAFVFNNKVNISVDDLTNKLKTSDSDYSKQFDDTYKKAIFYMYEKEVLASKQYQEIFNGSLNSNENANLSIELNSLEKIKDNQKKKINDLKNNLKTTYGYSTWENVFKERLLTDEYGKSTNEEDAVDHLTFKEVESTALRSTQVEVKTLSLDYINKTAKKTIYKIDANGNTVKGSNNEAVVLFNQGDKVFPYFKEGVNYFIQPNNPTKATVFLTKSYITDLITVDQVVLNYFNNNNILIPNSVLLPGIANTDSRFRFNLSDSEAKKKFINNLKYSVLKNSDSSISVSQNIDLLLGFKNPSEYGLYSNNTKGIDAFNQEVSRYKTYLSALTLTSDSTLGYLGTSSMADLINNNIDLSFGTVANELLKDTNDFKTVDLKQVFSMPSGFNTKIEQEIAKLVQEAKDLVNDSSISDQNEKFNKISAKLEEANLLIDRYFTELTNEQFNDVVLDKYNKNFEIKVANNSYNSLVYKVKDKENLLLVLTKSGVAMFANTHLDTLDKFKEYITKDLVNIAGGNSAFFNFQTKLNNFKSKELLVLNKLNDDQFVSWLLTQKNYDNKQYTNELIAKLKTEVSSVRNGLKLNEELTLYEKINTYIKEKVNSLSNVNFKNVDGVIRVAYLGQDHASVNLNNSKNAFELAEQEFQKYFKKGNK